MTRSLRNNSYHVYLFTFGIIIASLSVLSIAQQPTGSAQATANLFTSLYSSIEQMVIPKYNPDSGTPTQVILFEMPGLSVDRDAYDENAWSAQGFVGRQPDAVAATFVNRLPYYTGNVFVDSGSTISSIWGTFMYQYIIPIVDDPVQVARVNEARSSLANGTLAASFTSASDEYYSAYSQFVNFKTDCLAKQPGGVCATQAVILREQLKRKWFNQEVARRDIAAAESKILALQIQDLRNIFAEALYNYASSERVDMGGSGFGASYYLTYLTPSNFWRWWPSTGLFDVSVYADGSSVNVPVPSGAIVTQQPTFGTLTLVNATAYSYRPNAGYTGTDRFGMELTVLVNGQNVTSTVFRSIQIIGNDVVAADTAFVSVSASASSTQASSSSSSYASYAASTSSYSYQGWWNFQGSSSSSSSSGYSSSSSSSSYTTDSTTLQFDLARVLITRPWLDTSLLSFYPVAIRNLGARGWSDGTITPAPGPLAFKFKLLPVAFLVARKIVVGTTMSSQQQQYVSSASSNSYSSSSGGSGSFGGSFGPFFFGYRSNAGSSYSTSSGSSSSGYQESSKVSGGTISIRGPQVIGWLCTPVPPFPTASESEVRNWEAAQIARQLAALNGTTVLNAIKTATS